MAEKQIKQCKKKMTKKPTLKQRVEKLEEEVRKLKKITYPPFLPLSTVPDFNQPYTNISKCHRCGKNIGGITGHVC